MKTRIFYFSGTGNCLVVARDLAAELGESEIIPIPKAIDSEIDFSRGRIGIIYPVYVGGMPLMVKNFLEKIKHAEYVFAIATYAGMPGPSLKIAAKILKKQGVKLSSGCSVKMPGNYIPLYGAIPKEKQEKIFRQALVKIKEKIAPLIKQNGTCRPESNFFLINWIFGMIFRGFIKNVHTLDSSFYADEKCNSCGVCAEVCPVGNIRYEEGKPVWLHKCEQCFACLQWCPTEAIQFGKKSPFRKRYHNPNVTVQDIIGQK